MPTLDAEETGELSFGLLGPLEVRRGEELLQLGGERQRGPLAVLLLDANEVVPSERIVEMLFGSAGGVGSRNALHIAVSRLRRALNDDTGNRGGGVLATRPRGYLLRVGTDALDLALFERLCAEGRAALASEPAGAAAKLREALALWRGPALADLSALEFAQTEARRLEELRIGAVLDRVDADLALGAGAELVPDLEALVTAHPLQERPRAQLMLALYRCGRQADALELYRDARTMLAEELGLEPGAQLRELEQAILRQDESLRRATSSDGRSAIARVGSSKLPRPANPMVGRRQELAAVSGLLRSGEQRLLTLTGAGGAGKTRLALEAGAAVSSAFEDGVFWVPLVTVTDARLVPAAIAEALGAEGAPADHIGERRLLLVLDNFEQIVAAAPEVARLPASCWRLVVLVTSREPLHVAGEREFPLAALGEQDAVTLFEQRADAVRRGFERGDAVVEICRRVDCLPLAVELAAGRVKLLEPRELLERLARTLPLLAARRRDVPEHQRTMRATIEWSYELLDAESAQLFRRFAVFAGGCTLAAAERVCDARIDVLESLLDKSLLLHGGDRFSMLETIREYAAEQFQRSAEAAELRRRHADHYLGLAEDAAEDAAASLTAGAGDPEDGLDRLDAEHDNLRTALDWLGQVNEGEQEQRLAAALWRFWQRRGHFDEARRRLERALAADGGPTEARARAAYGAAVIAGDRGEYPAAKRLFEEALALEAFGNASTSARVRMNLGAIALQEGEAGRSRELLEEAVRAFDEIGDEQMGLHAMSHLATAHVDLGDLARARELDEEVARRARLAGNLHLEADALGALGECAAREGRLREAVPLLTESTRMFLALRDPTSTAGNLWRFGRVLAASGHAEAATEVFASADRLHEETGHGGDGWLVFNAETQAMIRAELDDAASYGATYERGRQLSADEAFARVLEALE